MRFPSASRAPLRIACLALLASAALSACTAPPGALADARAHEEAASAPSPTSSSLAAGPLSSPDLLDVPLPGPAPRPPLALVAGVGLPDDTSCARCHDEIAAEWQASLHRRAWQNDYFLRSYATERQALCRGCHAPAGDPAAEPSPAAREAGVGCTSCHVVTAGIVGTRALPGRPGGHAVLGDARLATPAACGACHDFPFPDAPDGAGPRQQDTLGEHRRSAASDRPCQTCHMPLAGSRDGGQHRDHTFRVQGDPAMLASAVRLMDATLEEGQLTLTIAPGEIGHVFPTGDVFRRAELRATPLDAAGAVLGPDATLVLARTFGPAATANGGLARAVRSDTRLASERRLTLSVPRATRSARYRIVWQRLPPSLAERLGMTLRDHETVVLEGAVSR